MRLADFLTDFAPAGAAGLLSAIQTETAREQHDLARFEEGYRAGWDDATRAMEEEGTRLHSDFAQNLRDLSFTYHEASSQILSAMTPLLDEIAATILPAALQDTLGGHIASRLAEAARDLGTPEIEIAVSPGDLALVEPLAEGETGLAVTVVADSSLVAGQADLRFATDHEERLDLSGIAAEIRTALTDFTEDIRRHAHG